MSRNVEERPVWHLKEFDKPIVVASHFGFVPMEAPKVKDEDLELRGGDPLDPHFDIAEKAAFLRTYLERELHTLPHPLGLSYKKQKNHHLELIDFPHGLAEAVLVRTALSMLREAGHKELVVDINCMGDKDSISLYEKELGNHLKKSDTEIPKDLKEELRKDVFNIIRHKIEETAELRESLPTPIAHLTTGARSYFKEVLEYIESLEVEFRLAPHLVGDKSFCSHTIFNIKDASSSSDTTLAVGYCYPSLGRKVGIKKETNLAGATVFFEPKRASAKKVYKDLPRPKYYLVQLGRDAKMRTLSTLEVLRKERIAVHHVIGRDKLTTQLEAAEKLDVPYLLLIGQKEALENSVTVRDMSTRAQDTVPVEHLGKYLKSLS